MRPPEGPKCRRSPRFLWFDDDAEEAIDFSLFDDSKVLSKSAGPDGKVLSVTFQLAGQRFMALNGGPRFQFTEAISLFVDCEGHDEVDELWEKLSDGVEVQMCGWLKDRYGLSWQIIPKALGRLMGDPDREKAGRVMQAMLKMRKIDVRELERAYQGS